MMSAYTGSEYIEPWVSYAKQEEEVKYNKNYDIVYSDGETFTELTCEALEDTGKTYTVLFDTDDCYAQFGDIGRGYRWNIFYASNDEPTYFVLNCFDVNVIVTRPGK